MLDMNILAHDLHTVAKDKGFWPEDRNLGEVCALIHSEVSELLECLRKPSSNPAKSGNCQEADEIADIIIRTLDLASHLGVDVEASINNKNKYNMNRPYKHGKNF